MSEKPTKTCTFKDLIFEDNIVKCEICNTVIISKKKLEDLSEIEEEPNLEF